MAIDILIVDDEEGIRNLMRGILQDEGYSVRLAANAEGAYQQIDAKLPDLLILDIWLQESHHDGMQILGNVKKKTPGVPVIMISGHGTIETAVSAIKKGAYDFIEKPFKSDRLLLMIERAIENAALKKENESLRQRAERINDPMTGVTTLVHGVQNILEKVAPTSSRVLITGETGTGKNLAARFIHENSKRAGAPFIVVRCTRGKPEDLEIELFGSAEGIQNEPSKIGALECAHEGTLLLEEIAALPVDLQGKILKFLQDGSYKRVGDSKLRQADVRILASTNADLEGLSKEGSFRQDLYHRLNVASVNMPPLRKRIQEMPALIENLTRKIERESGLMLKPFSDEALQALENYPWQGNIRQLRNMLEWVAITHAKTQGTFFEIEHLPSEIAGRTSASDEVTAIMCIEGNKDLINLGLRDAREVFERDYLLAQVKRFDGNVSKTAQFVGMERSALHRKLKSLDVLTPEKNMISQDNLPVKKASRS